MADEKPVRLRRGFEGLLRVVRAGGDVAVNVADPYHPAVSAYLPHPRPELPPLTSLEQLALSVFLGEPVPPAVLLSALEDAGVYPNGVLAAADEAENAPLDFGTPEYIDGEDYWDGRQRFSEVAGGWDRGQRAHVTGLCKGVFGEGNGTIGRMFGNFLDRWLGWRDPRGAALRLSPWPTTAHLAARMDSFPPLRRVFRHLLETCPPTTAHKIRALLDHLERR